MSQVLEVPNEGNLTDAETAITDMKLVRLRRQRCEELPTEKSLSSTIGSIESSALNSARGCPAGLHSSGLRLAGL